MAATPDPRRLPRQRQDHHDWRDREPVVLADALDELMDALGDLSAEAAGSAPAR